MLTTPLSEPLERGLDPNVRRIWLFNGLLGCLFTIGIAVVLELVVRKQIPFKIPPFLLGGAFFALTSLPGLLLIHKQYKAWRFRVTGDEVTIQYGIFWKTRRTIPRQRIQHVDITSGPFDRMFDLAQVAIFTAGSIAAVATIPGLSSYDAEQLRTELLGAPPQR